MALFLNYHVTTFVCGLTLATPFFTLQHRIINSPNTAMNRTDDTLKKKKKKITLSQLLECG